MQDGFDLGGCLAWFGKELAHLYFFELLYVLALHYNLYLTD